jgi:hypothetical protein
VVTSIAYNELEFYIRSISNNLFFQRTHVLSSYSKFFLNRFNFLLRILMNYLFRRYFKTLHQLQIPILCYGLTIFIVLDHFCAISSKFNASSVSSSVFKSSNLHRITAYVKTAAVILAVTILLEPAINFASNFSLRIGDKIVRR